MRAMILAAGQGRRLAPLTDHTPKPLLPIAGEPLLVRQVKQLRAAGITDIVINLYHLGEQITAELGDGSSLGVAISYSRESELLDTGGGIVNALALLGDEPFVLLNGDILTDFEFSTLPQQLDSQTLAHLVLTTKPESREFGDFVTDGSRITARGDGWVYCGIALIHPQLFANAPAGAFSLRDLYFDALASDQLSAQIHVGRWTDIGDLAAYAAVREAG
ncbi:MAG: NTP transferase domain-containing protein [Proteobacteria bacterium]|nr:NTP transferase domain-containing protein [Pseudomonadota bacterium]